MPNLTAQKLVCGASDSAEQSQLSSITACSAARLVLPITETGFTALSVEMRTNRLTPNSRASSASARVASVLLRQPSSGFASTIGTCL